MPVLRYLIGVCFSLEQCIYLQLKHFVQVRLTCQATSRTEILETQTMKYGKAYPFHWKFYHNDIGRGD